MRYRKLLLLGLNSISILISLPRPRAPISKQTAQLSGQQTAQLVKLLIGQRSLPAIGINPPPSTPGDLTSI